MQSDYLRMVLFQLNVGIMYVWCRCSRWWSIDPSVCRDPITEQEGELIYALVDLLSTSWRDITSQLEWIRYGICAPHAEVCSFQ